MLQPCPDCGTLMEHTVFAVETREGWCWRCPACGQHWTDQQIDEIYEVNSLKDDYSIYDMEEDGSYYDDEYEERGEGPDYDYSPWPDPDPTLFGRIKRLMVRLQWRWYAWRHKDVVSDIPF